MEERPIKNFIIQSSLHGRKRANLTKVIEGFRAMAQGSEPRLHSQDIFGVVIDEDTLTPDTAIVFAMKGGWGELSIQYTPGQAAIGNFGRIFDQMMTRTDNDDLSILKCAEGAFVRLLQKLPDNLGDAMDGLMEETVYETVDALIGKQITGEIKRKPWRDRIASEHAKRSTKRMGAHHGKSPKPGEFLARVAQAAERVKGRLVREKVAEELGISVNAFDQQVKTNGFKWSQIRELIARTREKS